MTTTEQIDAALTAGAQFIVSPGFDADLVAYAQKKGVPVYPGCTTPTDYHAALKFGLEVLKFFDLCGEKGSICPVCDGHSVELCAS